MVTKILRRSPFFELHRELGGRFVPFHGWELPVQFTSILKEHEAVRNSCGLFDVSHMGQIFIEGPQALGFLQRVNSNDVSRLTPGRCLYSHMLNERGGVVDDLIVARLEEARYLLVVNAGTLEKDFAWLRRNSEGFDVRCDDRSSEYAMLALQGPKAATVLEALSPEACGLKRFGALQQELFGQPAIVTRTGYTGEDGFEVTAPMDVAVRIWRTLAARGRSFGYLPCGLGARDTLRLEAGLLLYGADIDEEHTPLEAGYGWVVKFAKPDFIGKQALLKQKTEGLGRRLYGVKLLERGVPRPGAPVTIEKDSLGELSSAVYSPTLKTGVGLGYFEGPEIAGGTEVRVGLRGRLVRAEIVPFPFYKRPRE